MSYKILLPVDGSEGSLRAAHYIAGLASLMPAVEVIILNVQPEADNWMVRRSIKPDELAKMEQDWSEEAMIPERDVLQAAGVSCQMRMERGEIAPTVARLAQELSCQQIIMAVSSCKSTLADWLLGSVATKVLHLASVPVTFIK